MRSFTGRWASGGRTVRSDRSRAKEREQARLQREGAIAEQGLDDQRHRIECREFPAVIWAGEHPAIADMGEGRADQDRQEVCAKYDAERDRKRDVILSSGTMARQSLTMARIAPARDAKRRRFALPFYSSVQGDVVADFFGPQRLTAGFWQERWDKVCPDVQVNGAQAKQKPPPPVPPMATARSRSDRRAIMPVGRAARPAPATRRATNRRAASRG